MILRDLEPLLYFKEAAGIAKRATMITQTSSAP
jgi:hypothetical protein